MVAGILLSHPVLEALGCIELLMLLCAFKLPAATTERGKIPIPKHPGI